MKTQGGANRCLRSARLLVLGGSLFIAITIVTACLAIWTLHHDRIADEVKDTHNLAIVLAEQTARAFQAVDLVLQETQAMVLAAGATEPDQFRRQMGTEEVHQFLLDRLRSLPQANAISLIDNAGRIVSFSRSWPVPPIDTSDRDFYIYWREHNDTGLFIGEPVINKVTGAWVVTVTRRLSSPQGEFAGIVLGVVETRYFEDFYQAITTGDGEAASLFRRDGTLLARHPHVEDKIGEKIPKSSPWYENISSGGGTFRTLGYIGEAPRIVSALPVREYPLAVTVGVSEDVALAPWRRQSVMIALGAIGAVIGFAILFRALAVQFGRLEQKSLELMGKTVELEKYATELTGKTVELEEYSTELKRSNAELEQFAYIASHDLQEPLRMVRSYCELLQRRYGDKLDEAAGEFIGYAVDGASRMQQLIKDLLAYSRVGRSGDSFESLDINEVIEAALANLKGAIVDNEALIERAVLPRIAGERVQLAQLFQNLIGNAIKFRREDPPLIRITAGDAPGGLTQFTVEDNGIGIEAEYQERAFVIFQRLHDREKYTGTGIGLAIAKKVVEYHGGRIWIESTPGQGTRFHFTLPTAGPAEAPQNDAGAADRRQYA